MDNNKAIKRPALGRGLGALIAGGSPAERRGVILLGIEEIEPDRAQPRRYFNDEHLAELAESIKSKGVLLPILVRRTERAMYSSRASGAGGRRRRPACASFRRWCARSAAARRSSWR